MMVREVVSSVSVGDISHSSASYDDSGIAIPMEDVVRQEEGIATATSGKLHYSMLDSLSGALPGSSSDRSFSQTSSSTGLSASLSSSSVSLGLPGCEIDTASLATLPPALTFASVSSRLSQGSFLVSELCLSSTLTHPSGKHLALRELPFTDKPFRVGGPYVNADSPSPLPSSGNVISNNLLPSQHLVPRMQPVQDHVLAPASFATCSTSSMEQRADQHGCLHPSSLEALSRPATFLPSHSHLDQSPAMDIVMRSPTLFSPRRSPWGAIRRSDVEMSSPTTSLGKRRAEDDDHADSHGRGDDGDIPVHEHAVNVKRFRVNLAASVLRVIKKRGTGSTVQVTTVDPKSPPRGKLTKHWKELKVKARVVFSGNGRRDVPQDDSGSSGLVSTLGEGLRLND